MKTTILSQEGNTQIVLTPETEFEKDVVEKFGENVTVASLFKGSFSECAGGWTRQYPYKDSLMICVREGEKK